MLTNYIMPIDYKNQSHLNKNINFYYLFYYYKKEQLKTVLVLTILFLYLISRLNLLNQAHA